MKYAFIDYENLNSLDGLGLQGYDRIFLFIGAANNQTEIRLTEKFNDELNITLITVKNSAKNNLDFHITYYLGKLDEKCDKAIEFYILSNDHGYDGVCYFIQHQKLSRVCQRKEITLAKSMENITPVFDTKVIRSTSHFQKYVKYITQKEIRHLPVKLNGLKNHIHNYLGLARLNKNETIKIIDEIIAELLNNQLIKIEENKVIYFFK